MYCPLLSDDLKDSIREAYNAIIESKSLTPRWGQRQMIAEIANTLARIPSPGEARSELPAVCVIEAGTGTGKTIAYAVPPFPSPRRWTSGWSWPLPRLRCRNSSLTKTCRIFAEQQRHELQFCAGKGRRRYVCLSKLDRLLARARARHRVYPCTPMR